MPSLLIANTASALIERSRLRKSWIIGNEDGAISIFIKQERGSALTVSATDHDHRIGPGGSIALNWTTDGIEAIQDRWTIIAASGTPRVSFFETEDQVR